MLRQYELVDLVKNYKPNADEALLDRAYVYTMKVHGGQTRHSGDPYFSHPIEVAGILTKLKLDEATIVTALLHDTIEDTDTTYDDIRERFGEEIADLVNGVTKLSNIQFSDRQSKQAENFRKFFLATAKDVRVLLVKLADRLHNMRTIEHIPKEEKRKAIAQETMDIYAPLAGRIGMQGFREELEDRAFAVLNKDARESVINRLSYLNEESGDTIDLITEEIKKCLKDANLDAIVYGRQKRPYSVWRKMERKDISFEQLSDIIGFRIILKEKPECYAALGAVHSKWKMLPGFFKDYVSTPKRNGYQSIHTTVMGPDKQRVELQIRTQSMHDVAETGVAAHWDYKEQSYMLGNDKGHARDWEAVNKFASSLRSSLFSDLRGLADLLDEEVDSTDFLEHTKLEMYSDQVFAFTPKGDLISLPRGATAIDFAYAVHTTVGDTCVGVKINGQHRPLRSELKNGDSVEVLTSKAQGPTAEWVDYVVTGRAKSAIRRRIRQSRRSEFVDLGEKLLQSAFRRRDLPFSDDAVANALTKLKLDDVEDVYAEVGNGTLTDFEVMQAIYPGLSEQEWKPRFWGRRLFEMIGPNMGVSPAPDNPIPLKGLQPGRAVHFAPCCHPVPGDRIVGVVEAGEGVVVHTIDCNILKHQDGRWLDLQWDRDAEVAAVGQISIGVINEPGVLGEIASVIAQHSGNITNVRIVTQDSAYAEMVVDIVVDDVKHLNVIIAALRSLQVVNKIDRSRWTEKSMADIG